MLYSRGAKTLDDVQHAVTRDKTWERRKEKMVTRISHTNYLLVYISIISHDKHGPHMYMMFDTPP